MQLQAAFCCDLLQGTGHLGELCALSLDAWCDAQTQASCVAQLPATLTAAHLIGSLAEGLWVLLDCFAALHIAYRYSPGKRSSIKLRNRGTSSATYLLMFMSRSVRMSRYTCKAKLPRGTRGQLGAEGIDATGS